MRILLRSLVRSHVRAGATFALLSISALAAENSVRRFNLSAGEAGERLKDFSEQAGVQVLFPTDMVRGIRTNAVRGEFVPVRALEEMVKGTALVAFRDAETGALGIKRINDPNGFRAAPTPPGDRPKKKPDDSSNPTPPMKQKNVLALLGGWLLAAFSTSAQTVTPSSSTTTTRNPGDEAPVQLNIFEVTETRDEGYRSLQTVAGYGTLDILKNTPNTISVLNRELMDDINVTKIEELLEFSVTGQKSDNPEETNPSYQFRGVRSLGSMRNGFLWGNPVDPYNLERAEILRGPNGLLYGEIGPTGALNQLTKQAQFRNFQKGALILGNEEMYRVELDINRKLHDKVAARANFVYQKAEDGLINHTRRNVMGAYIAFAYNPWGNTSITGNVEHLALDEANPDSILQDGYSVTDVLGTTSVLSATNSGVTFLSGIGGIYNMTGTRRSSGSQLILTDTSILPRKANYLGSGAFYKSDYQTLDFNIAQKIGEDLNVQFSVNISSTHRHRRANSGAGANSVYRDVNPSLPDGRPNPYFNELYTEYYVRETEDRGHFRDWRIKAVYDVKLPFMTQRIVGMGSYKETDPFKVQWFRMEFVDPASPLFRGTLINENTSAAHVANFNTLNQNFFYRRFYLRDGDGADLTRNSLPIPGQTIFVNSATGAAGRLAGSRVYRNLGYGGGISGTYFNGRLRSLLGWRSDKIVADWRNHFWNPITMEEYSTNDAIRTIVNGKEDSFSLGGVWAISDLVSLYANFAEAAQLSSGVGGQLLGLAGSLRGIQYGGGYEYGVRWTLLKGRIESNWTYFDTEVEKQGAQPAIPALVRNELMAALPALDFSGGDVQQSLSEGLEFETIANLTPNWRLIWNISRTEVSTQNRFPYLKRFFGEARAAGAAMTSTEAFLGTVPDGPPLPGFTKHATNLVTNYRFSKGPLKNLSIGGGLNYRDKTFRGNFDFNRDGVAEEIWSKPYTLVNLIVGYRTRILDRQTDFNLTVNNLTDKEYFRSLSNGSGTWGVGRVIRLAIRFDL